MKYRKKLSLRSFIRLLTVVTAIIVVSWMYWVGRDVPFSEQTHIYAILRNVAATMFTVFGLWIGLLYPELRTKVFSRGKTTEFDVADNVTAEGNEEWQADRILQPFFLSLIILLVTFAAGVLGPIVKRAEPLKPFTEPIRGLSYSLIGLLAFLQVATIWRAMRITDNLKAAISRGKEKREVRLRIRQNKQTEE